MRRESSYLRHLGYVLGVSGADSRPGLSQLATGERHRNCTPSLQDSFLCNDKPQMLVYMVACRCAGLKTFWRAGSSRRHLA